MNDGMRRQWVLNDARLFALWRNSRMHVGEFVRCHRNGIDCLIAIIQATIQPAQRIPLKIGD